MSTHYHKEFVIAIDGPMASGKSTVSRLLAKKLNCSWLSTGVFYRGVAFILADVFSHWLDIMATDLGSSKVSDTFNNSILFEATQNAGDFKALNVLNDSELFIFLQKGIQTSMQMSCSQHGEQHVALSAQEVDANMNLVTIKNMDPALFYRIFCTKVFNTCEWIKSTSWRVAMEEHQTSFIYKDQDITRHILSEKVGGLASVFSTYSEVRKALLEVQRSMKNKAKNGGLVAEGRDCTTVVFPGAHLKVYLTAASKLRSIRRGEQASQEAKDVEKERQLRDKRDSEREIAPLIKGEQDIVIDSSELNLEAVVDKIHQAFQKKL